MRRLGGYPQWFYPALLAVLLALVVSGILLLPSMLELRLDWASPLHVAGNIRLASAALHSFSAFLTLALIGALATVHMRMGWKLRLNHYSGVALLLLFTFLLASAIGIFYFGDPDLSLFSSVSHSLVGLAIVALLIWHMINGQRLRKIQSKIKS